MSEEREEPPASPEIEFEPVVKLPLVDLPVLEGEEEDIVKLRARLYRFDSTEQPGEWKERGTGEMKLLRHKASGAVRVLMRRDKTFKVCANHYIQPHMELQPNADSDRAWIWSTPADFADDEPKPELLAIRFGSAENANKFKAAFEQAKKEMLQEISKKSEEEQDSESDSAEELSTKISHLAVKESPAPKEIEKSPAPKETEESPAPKETEESPVSKEKTTKS